MRFIFKTLLFIQAIYYLTIKDHLTKQDNDIQSILEVSKQLVANTHYLKFGNKQLIKSLKAKKKKKNWTKRLHLLYEKDEDL